MSLVRASGNGLTAMAVTIAAIMLAIVSPNQAARLLSWTVASAGAGAVSAMTVTRRRLEDLLDEAQKEVDRSKVDFRSKYQIKLSELQSRANKAGQMEEVAKAREVEIAKLRQDFSDRAIAYATLKSQFEQQTREHQEAVAKLEAEYKSKIQAAIEVELGERLPAIKKQIYQGYLQKLNNFQQRQIDRQNQFKKEALAQLEQSKGALVVKGDLTDRLKVECQDLIQSIESWVKEREQEEAQLQQQIEIVVLQHQEEIERLHSQIRDFLQPERLASTTKAAHTANRIADWYLQRNVVVDVKDAKEWLDRDEIWLKPRIGGLKPLKELADELWVAFELADGPEFSIEKGCVKLVAYSDPPLQPNVTFSVSAAKEDERRAVKEGKASDGVSFEIFDAASKLQAYIRNSDRLHFFVNGDSGSGKDTLINNIVNLVRNVLAEGGRQVKLTVIDAKHPNDSPIIIDGQKVKPKYCGINDEDDDEALWKENDCLAGLIELRKEVGKRLAYLEAIEDQGGEPADLVPHIWFVSEAEEIAASYDKTAPNCIFKAARLGRSLQLGVIINGQDPSCTAYGARTTAKMRNFAAVYLRENAHKGVLDLVKTTEQRKPLKRAIQWLEENSQGRAKDDPERYWGLFKLPGEPAFLAFLPPPNAFSGLEEEGAIAKSDGVTVEPVSPFDFEFQSGEDQLLEIIEARKEEIGAIEPEPVEAEIVPSLTVAAQLILDKYNASAQGKRITARWIMRQGARDLRRLKTPEIQSYFQELADAGYGTFKDGTWGLCEGEVLKS